MDSNQVGKIICQIEIHNPNDLTFQFNRKNKSPKGKVILDDAYARKAFSLRSNKSAYIGQVLNADVLPKLRKMFAIDVEGILSLQQQASTPKDTNIPLLDDKEKYILTYHNDHFALKNNRERLFLQETILTMTEIAPNVQSFK